MAVKRELSQESDFLINTSENGSFDGHDNENFQIDGLTPIKEENESASVSFLNQCKNAKGPAAGKFNFTAIVDPVKKEDSAISPHKQKLMSKFNFS